MMTKHLLTLSALTLAVGLAHAEMPQNLTIYGFVDVAVGKNPGQDGTHILDSSGSRLGFKGEQDLGNGLTGSFLIEHRFTPQTGAASDPFWKGGAFGSLSGGFGSVKIGRWWSQAYLKTQYASDPFGEATVAANYGPVGCGGPDGCIGAFWLNNSVSYEKSFGGLSFGAQVAESNAAGKHPWNVGVGYEAGGLYVGLGHEVTGNANAKWSHATVNYDFGVVKLYTGFGTGRDQFDHTRRNAIVGFVAPMGESASLIGAYNQHRDDGVTVQSKASLGYQYRLSKNMKLFTTLTSDSKAASSKTGYDAGMIYSW
jgi:predicted porin